MPFDDDPAEQIENSLTDLIERQIRGAFTSTLAIVRTLDDNTQRATVALKRDPDVKIPNVPIASTFARDGAGDVHPIEPGDEGMILCPHEEITDILDKRGHKRQEETEYRHHSIEDAVFLPASIYYREDKVPEHERGERVLSHPSGATIRQQPDGTTKIDHPLGIDIELSGVPEPEPEAGVKRWGDDWMDGRLDDNFEENLPERDRESFPSENEGDHYVRISHDVGVDLMLTENGIAITNGETEEGSEVRDVVSGQPNDGERIELDGHHQHRHVIPRPDGTYDLTGPPLSFRQFMEQFDPDGPDVATLDCDDEAEAAREYAEAYKAWLEEQTGEYVDPTDAALWPTPEPIPTQDEKAEFDPET
jgi:hypothetical protein